ncbi:hypothetical protein EON81_10960 [bacterium]|nr:MAG: hypothetical protein EON81_10960 [bacterium]
MRKRSALAFALLLFVAIGCNPAKPAVLPAEGGEMSGGVGKLTPGPGNATADERAGSKLGK